MKDEYKNYKKTDIVNEKFCDCGCGKIIYLKKWHYYEKSVIPRFILGHNPETQFKKGNKKGWNGGKYKQNGYWMIQVPNHPFCNINKLVKQSRLIMEKHIGRYLNRDEHVHHKNGVRDDDRIDNLVILNQSEHMSLHHKGILKKQKRSSTGNFIKQEVSNEVSA